MGNKDTTIHRPFPVTLSGRGQSNLTGTMCRETTRQELSAFRSLPMSSITAERAGLSS